ncbi:benzoate/H(+) symporter BenE family transporter [Paenibacillus abyssi]|uniref:Benzoate transporter n=1 Tax=Paenibacillus abyssi TaxID=1340531 RepID=A0A917LFS9_9BACL|nr:benzoate/H(+) symporter BenE family transporter [Paenibacillus abyssi]GGG19088.1 benzoate transporter [Paenibacillus abyssi]
MKSSDTGEEQAALIRGWHNPLRDLNSKNISAGVIASTLGMTGPPILILEAAANGGYTHAETIGWVFAVYFFGGVLSIFLPLLYRMPITCANSLSGIAFLATASPHFTYNEMTGGFLLSGILIFLIGITGAFTFIMKLFPREVIAAMLAGLVTSYVIRMITSIEVMPLVGVSALASYFLLMKWGRRIPPVVGAIVVALLVLFLTEGVHFPNGDLPFAWPDLVQPEFSWMQLFTLAIPLCLMILSNDAVPAIGALETYKYKPPTKQIITMSGITSMVVALFGGQSANVAGMMTAVSAEDGAGEKHKRYIASAVSGVMLLLFGIFASKTVPFMQALPVAAAALVGGFALIGVLGSSLHTAFSDSRYRFSAIFAFVIAMSPLSFFHISAPVWALIVGAIIAKTIEHEKPPA